MNKRWLNPFESAWFCTVLAILAAYQLYEVWSIKQKIDLISAVYFTCCIVLLITMRKKIFKAITGFLIKENDGEE